MTETEYSAEIFGQLAEYSAKSKSVENSPKFVGFFVLYLKLITWVQITLLFH